MADSLESADRIVAMGEAHPGRLVFGHMMRFDPRWNALRRAVEDGRLGNLVHLSNHGFTPDYEGRALADRISLVNENAIHGLDLLQWLGGPIERVYGEVSRTGVAGEGLVDAAAATLRFRSGAIGTIETDWAMPSADRAHRSQSRTIVVGSEGVAWIDARDSGVGHPVDPGRRRRSRRRSCSTTRAAPSRASTASRTSSSSRRSATGASGRSTWRRRASRARGRARGRALDRSSGSRSPSPRWAERWAGEYAVRSLSVGTFEEPGYAVFWMAGEPDWVSLRLQLILIEGDGIRALVNTALPDDLSGLRAEYPRTDVGPGRREGRDRPLARRASGGGAGVGRRRRPRTSRT